MVEREVDIGKTLDRERRARIEAEQLLEEKSRALYYSNKRLIELLENREGFLDILGQFALDMRHLKDEESVCWYVARKVVAQLGFSDCVIYLVDAEREAIVQKAAIADKNPEAETITNPLVIPLGQGITGSVACSGKAEIIDDVTKDPRFIYDIAPCGSEICVPMIHEDSIIGVIDSEATDKGFFSQDHMELLTTIASYTAAKIAERRAQSQSLQRALELEEKIAELTRTRDELQKAKEIAEQTSKMKSLFVATVSHEIRTPLAAIVGSIDMLQDQALDTRSASLVEMARSSGHILQTLLNDVIDFARGEAGSLTLEPADFSIHELVGSIQSLWQAHFDAKGNALNLEVAPTVAKNYCGDIARLRQVINNFISNALKYGAGSDVTFEISVRSQKDNCDKLRFAIADSGPGINRQDQKLLFQQFSRVGNNKRRIGNGAGLGLAISKQMATLMGGKIGVNSKTGKGACFWVDIPLERAIENLAPVAEVKDLACLKAYFGRSPRVLVAEDFPTNQLLIRMAVEKFGCRVTVANNGVEAVKLASKGHYDVILMDIAMPELDGVAATRRITKILGDKTPPIYALTAHGMDEDRAEFMANGMQGIITKPFDRADLHSAIKNAIPNNQQDESFIGELTCHKHAKDNTIFDTDGFKKLLFGMNDEQKTRLIQQCLKDFKDCQLDLCTGIENGDCNLTAGALHKLKSISGAFGLGSIHHMTVEAYNAFRQNDTDKGMVCAKSIPQALGRGITHIDQLYQALVAEGDSV